MLKIKDNIDLKELEKYGFVFYERNYLNYPYYYNNECDITINCLEREIYSYYDDNKSIDKIFDLIKDGLVEKVSNK